MARMTVIRRARTAALSALILTGLAPAHLRAQTWISDLRGDLVVPRSDSPASGSLRVRVVGTNLNVAGEWNGLQRFSEGVELRIRSTSDHSDVVALMLPRFPVEQRGSYDDRIDLTARQSYTAAFLKRHGNDVAAARTAFIAALTAGEGQFVVRSQRNFTAEMAGRLELTQ